jgi:hypothetical protein
MRLAVMSVLTAVLVAGCTRMDPSKTILDAADLALAGREPISRGGDRVAALPVLVDKTRQARLVLGDQAFPSPYKDAVSTWRVTLDDVVTAARSAQDVCQGAEPNVSRFCVDALHSLTDKIGKEAQAQASAVALTANG